ncbi:MAG TPA: cytochrome c [Burkholderiaceae bacterium]|nr:cytochrome c [Burkholderiaceae bacterium]
MTRSFEFNSVRVVPWLAAALLWFANAGGQVAIAGPNDIVAPIVQAIVESNRLYLGWRVFQANCARCHGADATGTDKGPDLLARVRTMSQEEFIGTVLRRYQWVLPSGEGAGGGSAPDALIADLAQRQRGELQMPAWEKEPAVTAHIADLYDYLQARANGSLGPGRPPWPGN